MRNILDRLVDFYAKYMGLIDSLWFAAFLLSVASVLVSLALVLADGGL